MCLQWGTNLAGVRELPPVGLLPSFLVNSKVLHPLRCQTGGTVLVSTIVLFGTISEINMLVLT